MKKLPLAKKKKVSKTRLKNKLDALFSKHIRKVGYCQAEGKLKGKCGGGLQTAHIEGRINYRLRWNEMNVLCLCAGHHRYAHAHPLEFFEFVLEYYPEKYSYINKHKHEIVKMTPDLYKKMIEHYGN